MDDEHPPIDEETERLVRANERLESHRSANGGFFSYESLAHIVRIHDRHRETLRLLKRHGFHPLAETRLLDVGCGDGNLLRQCLQWGAQPANLAGIELQPDPVALSHELSPNLDVRCGSATSMPWSDESFDLVSAHTVFTSILSPEIRGQVAAEMDRVLRPGGAILWYDFMYDNPRNPDVRGVKRDEVQALFPAFDLHLRRISLAPPIARRIPSSLLPLAYPLLASFPPLRTHYLGLLLKSRDRT